MVTSTVCCHATLHKLQRHLLTSLRRRGGALGNRKEVRRSPAIRLEGSFSPQIEIYHSAVMAAHEGGMLQGSNFACIVNYFPLTNCSGRSRTFSYT